MSQPFDEATPNQQTLPFSPILGNIHLPEQAPYAQVHLRGNVSGVVCAKNVALQSSSEVQGYVHHMSFAIEQGALFEGRSRRAANEEVLNSVIEGRSTDRSYAGSATDGA